MDSAILFLLIADFSGITFSEKEGKRLLSRSSFGFKESFSAV
jgi:hypothetical protein